MKALGMALLAAAALATGASAQTDFGSGAGGAIADGPLGCGSATGGTMTTFGSINIAAGTIMAADDFTVTVEGLSHTWLGDLSIVLQGPGGQNFLLLDQFGGGDLLCGSGNDFAGANLAFSNGGGAFANGPVNSGDISLAPLNNAGSSWNNAFATSLPGAGVDVSGTWTLAIHDVSAQDTGSITGWSLSGTIPGPGAIALLGVAGLVGRRRRA